MSWAKIDDHFFGHPKVVNTSLAARGLWITALSWTAALRTDGWIPEEIIPVLAADGENRGQIPTWVVEELVSHRLWERGEGGYRIHDFLDWNPSREEVDARRAATNTRVAAYRERKRVTHADGNTLPSDPVTLLPSRPGPSDPVTRRDTQSGSVRGSVRGTKTRRAARATPLPPDFTLTDARLQFARDGHVEEPELEFGHFLDYHRAHGTVMIDWEAAWRTWCRNARKFQLQQQRRLHR